MASVRQRKERDEGRPLASHGERAGAAGGRAIVESLPRAAATYAAAMLLPLLMCYVVHRAFVLPTPRPAADTPVHEFSEGRAWQFLGRLQDTGMSMIGTKANDAVAAQLVSELTAMDAELAKRRLAGQKGVPQLEISVQHPSGGLIFEIVTATLVCNYANLTNVIARISFSEEAKDNAVLINSHFDTPIGSEGAMDDRASVSIMLELVRALLHSPRPLRHAVIFLFNGAEESLQMGSHGFVTQHEWASTCRSIINLDAAGVGGPEILFQSGHYDFVAAYSAGAPWPHGSVIAQDVFGTGFIQSDTDYRIFRDYKNLTGLDLAFYCNSYLYHTPGDNFETLHALAMGSMQHEGDNVLGVLHQLLAPESRFSIESSDTPSVRAVYYELFGRWMLVYSVQAAMIGNWVLLGFVAALVIYLHSRRLIPVSRLAARSLTVAACAGASVASALMVALLLESLKRNMSWFAHKWLGVSLYGLSAWIGMQLVLGPLVSRLQREAAAVGSGAGGDASKESASALPFFTLERDMLAGVLIFYASQLLLSTCLGLGSSFVPFYHTLFATLALLFSLPGSASSGQRKLWSPVQLPAWVYCFFLLPLYFVISMTSATLEMFFPLMGRIGSDAMVDVVVASLTSLLLCDALVLLLLVFVRAGCRRAVLRCSAAMLGALLLFAAFVAFPYSAAAPKRVILQHVMMANPSGLELPADYHPHLRAGAIINVASVDPVSTASLAVELVGAEAARKIDIHDDRSDFDSLYPFNFFFAGFSLNASQLDLATPTLVVVHDEFDATNNTRSLTLRITYTGEWSTLRLTAPLLWWDATNAETGLPPAPNGYYMIRHVGAYGNGEWQLRLQVQGREKFWVDVGTQHFVESADLSAVLARLPTWAAPLFLQAVFTPFLI